MKNLLRFELFKLRKRKSLYICTAAMLATSLFSLLINYMILRTLGFEYAPSVISYTLSATSSADFTLIAGIFIALYVCEDFGQKTIKNVYSRGFSRAGAYFSKLIVCFTYVVAAFVIVELFTLGVGSALFGYRAEEGHILALLFGQLLVCLAYASFALAIGFVVKKTGVAVAVTIFAPVVLSLVLALADVVIDSENFMVSNYWLEGIATNLANPLASVKEIVIGCVLSVIYSVLFITLGFFIHRDAEV